MRFALLLTASLLSSVAAPAQRLQLPPRSPGALTGSAFSASVADLPPEARDRELLAQITQGNVPSHLRDLVPVTITETIEGIERTLTYYVLPDYLSVGSDDDYILMPMTPHLAQAIADTADCILPTRKMVDDIYWAAELTLRPQPIPPSPAMTTVPVFVQHNDSIRQQRRKLFGDIRHGALVAGHKKDVIISNSIYVHLRSDVPHPVVIYGWHRTSGAPIQPLYNGHTAFYADYSHGIRLVQRKARQNAHSVELRELLVDSELSALASDEGVIARPEYEAVR